MKNLSQFLDYLTKALLEYTNLDPQTLDGKELLMTYFFSQSSLMLSLLNI